MSNPRRAALGLLLALTACALTVSGPALAQDMDEQAMMQAYQKAAQPGPEHEWLAGNAGTWNVTMRSWMDPEGEPIVSQGSETAEMILGGRYLESHFQGQAMGQPFQGLGLLGYDNLKQKYVGIWCDSMGTGIMSYEGTYDPDKKELVCKGDFIDAATGQTQTATLVSREVDPDHHVFEMWSPGPDGQPVKWMEMDYTRAE